MRPTSIDSQYLQARRGMREGERQARVRESDTALRDWGQEPSKDAAHKQLAENRAAERINSEKHITDDATRKRLQAAPTSERAPNSRRSSGTSSVSPLGGEGAAAAARVPDNGGHEDEEGAEREDGRDQVRVQHVAAVQQPHERDH
jgi:hypothetical protein